MAAPISQATEDHLVTAMLQAAQRSGHYEGVMAEASPEEREAIEAAVDRHAGRQRAAGKAGW